MSRLWNTRANLLIQIEPRRGWFFGGGGGFSHKANQKNSDFYPSRSNAGSSTALTVIFLNASEKASDISESAWPRCGNRETKGAADVTFRVEGFRAPAFGVFYPDCSRVTSGWNYLGHNEEREVRRVCGDTPWAKVQTSRDLTLVTPGQSEQSQP